MNTKQKLFALASVITLTFGISIAAAPLAFAGNTCGGVDTSIITCNAGEKATGARDSAIWEVLILILNILTAGVGILAVGGIAYGAVLYASAGDKQDQTKKAVSIITNVVIGIAAFGLMYLFLNFLIPGGIFT